MRTKLFNAVKVSALAILLSFGLSFVYAWTAPTQNPPAGNVSAPINTSATAQTKAGDLAVTGNILVGAATSSSQYSRLYVNGETTASPGLFYNTFNSNGSSWNVLNFTDADVLKGQISYNNTGNVMQIGSMAAGSQLVLRSGGAVRQFFDVSGNATFNGSIRPTATTTASTCSTLGAQAYDGTSGVPLYCDGTAWAGSSHGKKRFTKTQNTTLTGGLYKGTFTVPSGVTKVWITMSGGGGGGGVGAIGGTSAGLGGGGGGGGGSYVAKEFTVTSPSSYDVFVGVGGGGGVLGAEIGGTGGSSSFGSLIASGGGGGGGGNSSSKSLGGAGGSGDLFEGGYGVYGEDGQNSTSTGHRGGAGGGSAFGSGGAGGRGASVAFVKDSCISPAGPDCATKGYDGGGYGGGGGGGGPSITGTGGSPIASGGVGYPGFVLVEW